MKPQKADQAERPVRGLFALPSGDVPTGTRCVKLNIPDGDDYERLLMGALDVLQHWNSYQRDVTKKGTEVAAAWRQAFLDHTLFEGCNGVTQVQFRKLTDCSLEASFDGGMEWVEIFNAYDCGYAAGQDAIEDGITDGTIGRPGQTGPGGEVPALECQTFHVELRGNDKWICPVPIETNFTVRVFNASGGWGDGGVFWYCPDGKPYHLGACDAEGQDYDEGDPLPTAYHGQIIGARGATPVYFDPLTSAYTVPEGVDSEPMRLQMNDDPISDNLGSVTFDVEICNIGWCFEWDFELGSYGWVIEEPWGDYIEGVGFQSYASGGVYSLVAGKYPAASFIITHMEMDVTATIGGGDVVAFLFFDGSFHVIGSTKPLLAGSNTYSWDENITIPNIYVNPSGQGDGPAIVTRVLLRGVNANPFGATNCT